MVLEDRVNKWRRVARDEISWLHTVSRVESKWLGRGCATIGSFQTRYKSFKIQIKVSLAQLGPGCILVVKTLWVLVIVKKKDVSNSNSRSRTFPPIRLALWCLESRLIFIPVCNRLVIPKKECDISERL